MTDIVETPPERTPLARRIGAVLQGLLLGALVSVAILNLIEAASGAQIFRYQGF